MECKKKINVSQYLQKVVLRVATSQLNLNSLTFPDFFGALFPDFPWPNDTNLIGIACNAEWSEEKICTCNHWIVTKICLEIRDKLWVTSARSFSLTLDKKYWNSLTFQKVKIFPDFPWWWQPCCTLGPPNINGLHFFRHWTQSLMENEAHYILRLNSCNEPESGLVVWRGGQLSLVDKLYCAHKLVTTKFT